MRHDAAAGSAGSGEEPNITPAEAWSLWMDLVYGRLEGSEAFAAEHLLLLFDVAWD
jgi:hypothetical protein